MASRFTATLSGTPLTLTVTDTAASPPRVILQMPQSSLYGAIGTGTPATASISIDEVERPFETPYGQQLEMGFDLTFTLTAGASPVQVGRFTFNNLRLKSPVGRVDTRWTNDFFCRTTGAFDQSNYPGDMYSPIVVLRNTLYNLCIAMCYPALDYNHGFKVSHRIETSSGNPSTLHFEAGLGNGLNPIYMIPAGEIRIYRIRFRINDNVGEPIGSAPDAPGEWLWTLRGYQQYFRHLCGKPNYRPMGGWDGRPCYGRFMAPGPVGPFRLFKTENDPTEPGGYNRVVDRAIVPPVPPATGQCALQQGFKRIIFWAMSGWADPAQQGNYPFKFMTGISNAGTPPMPQSAVDTLPAMHRINRAGMKLGFWWGRSSEVPFAAEWNGNPPGGEQLDPSNATHVSKANAELDKAIENGAKIIGLDAFGFPEPGTQMRWALMLKARAPRLYFVTEQMLPDYLHVLFPTFLIETSAVGISQFARLSSTFAIINYLNPGAEVFISQKSVDGASVNSRIEALAALGLSPISEYLPDVSPVVGVAASDRWTELGEAARSRYKSVSTNRSWRERDWRGRSPLRPGYSRRNS